MEKEYCWPEGHWNWPIAVTHKHGVRCGEMIWVGGQVSLTPTGDVLDPHVLEQQVARVILNFAAVLHGLHCDLEDLVSLVCFYVNDGAVDEIVFLRMVADFLPEGTKTTVNAVPVPGLAYDGLMVEIEGCAMRRKDGGRTSRTYAFSKTASFLPQKFCPAIRSGKMIFVSGQYPFDSNGRVPEPHDVHAQSSTEMKQIGELLTQFGASHDDVVKISSWYLPDLLTENTDHTACTGTDCFAGAGPAITNLPIPRHADNEVSVKISCIAMLGENGERLPRRYTSREMASGETSPVPSGRALKCDNMIFLGGFVTHAGRGSMAGVGDMPAQTHRTMRRIGETLNELDAHFDDVCKVTAFYRGDCGTEALHSNLPIRSSCFSDPGPSTTGIPLPCLANPGILIAVEVFAMATPDERDA